MTIRMFVAALLLGILGAPVFTAPVLAQEPDMAAEEAAIREVVETVFRGMRQADSAMVRSVFDPGARFAMMSEDGEIGYSSIDGWVNAVGGSEGRWDERVYDVEVRVDLPIASVWAPFTFYLDGNILHCGINTIEMLRTADGWRITQISDSRRNEGCPDPRAEEDPGASGD